MKRVKKYFVVSVLSFIVYTFAFWFQGCEQDFLLPENVVRFPVAIETELNASGCNATSCHNNEDQAGGLNLEDWTKTMNGTKKRRNHRSLFKFLVTLHSNYKFRYKCCACKILTEPGTRPVSQTFTGES